MFVSSILNTMSGEETVYYSSGNMLYNVVQGRLTVSGEETDLFGKRPFRAGCADLRRRRGTGVKRPRHTRT